MNKHDGELLYRLDGCRIGTAEARGALNGYGFLTRLEDRLYLGSADGFFSKL